jgi:hypothetical protein
MPDRPSTPPAPPPRGKITRIAVTYTVNTSDGPRHTFHGLIGMQRYVRPERLQELEDDLSVICEDLLANRPQPVTGLPTDVVRIPFGTGLAPAVADGTVPGPVAACRDLLAAVADALDCPPPAAEADEGVFLRLRSDRAGTRCRRCHHDQPGDGDRYRRGLPGRRVCSAPESRIELFLPV